MSAFSLFPSPKSAASTRLSANWSGNTHLAGGIGDPSPTNLLTERLFNVACLKKINPAHVSLPSSPNLPPTSLARSPQFVTARQRKPPSSYPGSPNLHPQPSFLHRYRRLSVSCGCARLDSCRLWLPSLPVNLSPLHPLQKTCG